VLGGRPGSTAIDTMLPLLTCTGCCLCGVKVLDIHETIAARVEAERQRRIEEVRQQTIADAIATVKARLEAEAAAREAEAAAGEQAEGQTGALL